MNVLVEEQSLQDIANAIREKNGSADTYKPSEMGNAVRAIESGGEDLLRYASIIQFNDEIKMPSKVVLNLDNVTNLNTLCGNTSVEELTINLKKECVSMDRMIYPSKANALKKITLNFSTSLVTSMRQAFCWIRTEGAEIIGELDFSSATNVSGIFDYSTELTELRVKQGTLKYSLNAHSCQKLSDESIDSLVNGFADMTGQTAIVLTVHKDVKARIEANQTWLSTLTSKNVTLA